VLEEYTFNALASLHVQLLYCIVTIIALLPELTMHLTVFDCVPHHTSHNYPCLAKSRIQSNLYRSVLPAHARRLLHHREPDRSSMLGPNVALFHLPLQANASRVTNLRAVKEARGRHKTVPGARPQNISQPNLSECSCFGLSSGPDPVSRSQCPNGVPERQVLYLLVAKCWSREARVAADEQNTSQHRRR
jgi:hypothetical protein